MAQFRPAQLTPVDTTGCARFTFFERCDCGGTAEVDAEVSVTGKRLPSGYTPERSEVVSYHSIQCRDCGASQVS